MSKLLQKNAYWSITDPFWASLKVSELCPAPAAVAEMCDLPVSFIKVCRFPVFHAGSFVPGASERVNIAYAWVQQLLQERLKDEGLTLAAPVGSRMWQILSEGYAQFEMCRCLS